MRQRLPAREDDMISRRNFFSISVLMCVVFFLCMFINNLKDTWNDYTINAYIDNAEDYPSQVNMFLPRRTQEKEDPGEKAGESGEAATELVARNRVVCIGDADTALGKTLREWVAYTKRELSEYESLSAFRNAADIGELPEMLLIDAACADWEREAEVSFLMECVEQGTHLVFCTLPEASLIAENEALRNLLGIREVTAEVTTVDGIHLYGGFLLGGEVIYQALEEEEEKYQDMQLTFPWYHLASGTKVYMKGIPADESVDTEDYPVLIWRKSFGTAYVFAVNGGYMDGSTALGLLSAMSAEMYSYELYPVVNAQCMSFIGFPSLAAENDARLKEIYSQSLNQVFQEIIWPDISAAFQQYGFGLTCMMTPQYDYLDDNLPDPEQLEYYLKIFNEQSAEVGLSGMSVSEIPMEQKLEEDAEFFQEAMGGYEFASFYAGDLGEEEIEKALQEESLSTVRTVLTEQDESKEIIRFRSEYVTEQNVLGDGLDYTYRNDFLTRTVETAMGYLNLAFDMERVAYPEDEEDAWEKLSRNFTKTLASYGQKFGGFDGTTVSESDLRIRHFLALDYADSRTGDTIQLEVEGTWGTAYFILRTHNEAIKEVEGGNWKELEEGAYLIEGLDRNITITLEASDERYYR